ncbi:unnamed protein product [Pleuronectes platessa]|uniref:Uncharacterized protein n=1 Tax=Pleuronectes platessa TaxID=8262 RepID=A0A9N7U2E2_PLEPL|nr:unnamed protein product [Pleuronectes platessa]
MSLFTEPLYIGVLLVCVGGQRLAFTQSSTSVSADCSCGTRRVGLGAWDPCLARNNLACTESIPPPPPPHPAQGQPLKWLEGTMWWRIWKKREKDCEHLLTAGVFGGIRWKGACSWSTQCEASTLTFSPKPAFDDFYPRHRTLQTFLELSIRLSRCETNLRNCRAMNNFTSCSSEAGEGLFIRRGRLLLLLQLNGTGPAGSVALENETSSCFGLRELRETDSTGLAEVGGRTDGESAPRLRSYPRLELATLVINANLLALSGCALCS